LKINLKVGVVHSGYPEIRNIIDLPYEDIDIVKIVDIFKIYTHIYYKIFRDINYTTLNMFYDAKLNNTDINHFFNGISFSNKPWITTFETSLPRFNNAPNALYDLGIKRLAHPSCKKIIAISQSAYEIQKSYLKEKYPQYYQSIVSKMVTIHPAQKLFTEDYRSKKSKNQKIKFLIVGNQIFSKGGREAMYVISRIYNEGYDVELSIISILDYDNITKTTGVDIEYLKEFAKKNKECIKLLGYITNQQVIEQMRQTDIVLLPTLADTYGYSVLEAQASGCPVISTDIRALTETNNNECGWIIDVPKDKYGDGILKTKDDRELFSRAIEEQLYRIIKDEILAHKDTIEQKAKLARERIRKYHNPKDVAQKIEEIYKEALL